MSVWAGRISIAPFLWMPLARQHHHTRVVSMYVLAPWGAAGGPSAPAAYVVGSNQQNTPHDVDDNDDNRKYLASAGLKNERRNIPSVVACTIFRQGEATREKEDVATAALDIMVVSPCMMANLLLGGPKNDGLVTLLLLFLFQHWRHRGRSHEIGSSRIATRRSMRRRKR
jgi:hypothetical protein